MAWCHGGLAFAKQLWRSNSNSSLSISNTNNSSSNSNSSTKNNKSKKSPKSKTQGNTDGINDGNDDDDHRKASSTTTTATSSLFQSMMMREGRRRGTRTVTNSTSKRKSMTIATTMTSTIMKQRRRHHHRGKETDEQQQQQDDDDDDHHHHAAEATAALSSEHTRNSSSTSSSSSSSSPSSSPSSWRHEDWVDSQLQLNEMAERIREGYYHHQQQQLKTNNKNNKKTKKESRLAKSSLLLMSSSSSSSSSSPSSSTNYNDTIDFDDTRRMFQFVKVMETFHGPIDMAPLLRVLPKSHITTLCLVGVHLEESHSRLLARALCDSRTVLERLQLCRLSRWGVSAMATALSFNRQLKELRLTFHHDLSLYHFSLLTHAIQHCNTTLQVLKLYCANLQGPCTQYLADMLRYNRTLLECRLTGCNIQELHSLALAIRHSNTLERLDLSMNRMADTESIAILLETPSLRSINLAENELGSWLLSTSSSSSRRRRRHAGLSAPLVPSSSSSSSSPIDMTTTTTTLTSSNLDTTTTTTSTSSSTTTIPPRQHFITAMAQNTTLEYLSLDMNPLTLDVVDGLHQALLYRNTTLLRLCLLTISVPASAVEQVEYLVAMNRAGRGLLRLGNAFRSAELMPHVLSAVSAQPTLLYGMLTELPHLWM